MIAENANQIEHYLHTGEHDLLASDWHGNSIIERCRGAHDALKNALVAAVLDRTLKKRGPRHLSTTDIESMTRARVRPMVNGLFAQHERHLVMDVLARSVVFLTPRNINAVLRAEQYLHTAWNLANLYLLSCDAEPLSPDAPQLIGLSQNTTCFVSMRYFQGGGRFDDVVVHEAAHIFHNCKRERIGLPHTAQREWLLGIEFSKRETFAYACEAFARILALGHTRCARRELLAAYQERSMPSDDAVEDQAELINILHDAVEAKNGWPHILSRCAPLRRLKAKT